MRKSNNVDIIKDTETTETTETAESEEIEEVTEYKEISDRKESMKSEIIKYAMGKIGTKRVSTLDGMTLEYKNKCYNIYVDDNNVTVEEIKEETTEPEATLEPEATDTSETDHDRINYLMETHSFPSITDMYNDKCFCCPADRKGNECKGKETCGKTWKRYEAIINPEWHHVSLSTLDNLDFDMIDEKRQRYLTVYRELQETLARLRKCKTVESYDKCFMCLMRRKNVMWSRGEISNEMWHYIEVKLSMQNVESGVWASYNEKATGYHKSRRYNKSRA